MKEGRERRRGGREGGEGEKEGRERRREVVRVCRYKRCCPPRLALVVKPL